MYGEIDFGLTTPIYALPLTLPMFKLKLFHSFRQQKLQKNYHTNKYNSINFTLGTLSAAYCIILNRCEYIGALSIYVHRIITTLFHINDFPRVQLTTLSHLLYQFYMIFSYVC